MKKIRPIKAKVVQLPVQGKPDLLEEIFQALIKIESDIDQHLNNQSDYSKSSWF